MSSSAGIRSLTLAILGQLDDNLDRESEATSCSRQIRRLTGSTTPLAGDDPAVQPAASFGQNSDWKASAPAGLMARHFARARAHFPPKTSRIFLRNAMSGKREDNSQIQNSREKGRGNAVRSPGSEVLGAVASGRRQVARKGQITD